MQDDDLPDPDDSDRTIIKPVPGGRRPSAPPPATPSSAEPRAPVPPMAPGAAAPPMAGQPLDPIAPVAAPAPQQPMAPPVPPPAPPTAPQAAPQAAPPPAVPAGAAEPGGNPLTGAATTVFALVKHLRTLSHYDDVPRLHGSVIQAVQQFEAAARSRGADQEAVNAARYAVCALLDETVLTTPWGSNSSWTQESLLGTFHGVTVGGEQFFQIVQNASRDPARHLHLLEFLHICLSLGFQGKYGAMDRGEAQLAEIRQNLYRTIANQRGEQQRELSSHWQGVVDKRLAVARFVPLWVVPIVACALAVLIYMGFSYYLNRSSDEVFVKLNSLGKEIPVMQRGEPEQGLVIVDPGPSDGVVERLSDVLGDEVNQGLVDVVDLGTVARVVVHNKGLFPSGQASVTDSYQALLAKIAAALDKESGPILVTGHTDNQPIRSLRFPSNWHLSQERAESVMAALAKTVGDTERLVAEGRGDTEAIATNETAEGRRQNRRIEINLPTR
jgi:type VI secretion system protein ImpK